MCGISPPGRIGRGENPLNVGEGGRHSSRTAGSMVKVFVMMVKLGRIGESSWLWREIGGLSNVLGEDQMCCMGRDCYSNRRCRVSASKE
jgi:hypothetical protein